MECSSKYIQTTCGCTATFARGKCKTDNEQQFVAILQFCLKNEYFKPLEECENRQVSHSMGESSNAHHFMYIYEG